MDNKLFEELLNLASKGASSDNDFDLIQRAYGELKSHKTPVKKLYKLRDKTTGKFKIGGINKNVSKEGKTWSSLVALKSALSLYDICTTDVSDFEIVEYECIEKNVVDIKDINLLRKKK